MYTMRAELKISFRAKQRAQINERKVRSSSSLLPAFSILNLSPQMMDAKRRFSSYIFHEVRVPLNTALLAVQNLSGLNLFDKHGEHAIEYQALEGSLQMMSQVLNVRSFSSFSSFSPRPPRPLANLLPPSLLPLRRPLSFFSSAPLIIADPISACRTSSTSPAWSAEASPPSRTPSLLTAPCGASSFLFVSTPPREG